MFYKSLLIPINSKKEIFIQDRRGYKIPDWGFFAGSIEEGETPLMAVIREAKEELSIGLSTEDLMDIGERNTEYENEKIIRHIFLFKTEGEYFDVQEGNGGVWMSARQAGQHLMEAEQFDVLWAEIIKVLE